MMSAEIFWTKVGAYNAATWPIQVVMIVAAAVLTYRVFARPGLETDAWMKGFLAFAFAWNGTVFFLVCCRSLISMAIGAPLFVVVSVLFVVDIFGKKTRFRFPEGGWMRGFTIVWILLALLYPLIGWPLGHVYPKVLLPLFPCPLTIFATALVAAAVPSVDRKVLIALLPWGLLGLPKCFGALDCYEDCVLFAAGVYGLVVLVKNWRLLR